MERANKTIGEVIRLNKGNSLKTLKNAIHVRLNETWHSGVQAIPAKILRYPITHKPKIKCLPPETTHNRIKVNSIVYVKRYSEDKVEPVWDGPFKVVKVSTNGNCVKVRNSSVFKTVNIRNVRERAGCGGPQ